MMQMCPPLSQVSKPFWSRIFRDRILPSASDTCMTRVTSECTSLLSQRLGYGGFLDSGFSSCTAPTYYCRSEYFLNCCPQVQNLIRTECSLNRSKCRVKNKAS